MALWDEVVDKTNPTALAFKRMLNYKTIDSMRRKSGLLYAILGKEEPGATPGTGKGFQRLKSISGTRHAVRIMGPSALSTINTPSDGAQEYAAATGYYDADIWGQVEFQLTHQSLHQLVPNSEIVQVTSSEKGASLLEEYGQLITTTFETSWANAVNTAQNQLRATIGGWPWAVSDGTSTGETGYDDYGYCSNGTALDRADNTSMAPYIGVSTGELTIPKIQRGINEAVAKGGNPTISPVGTVLYGKAQALAQAYVQTNYDASWDKFGGKFVDIGGVKFILEGGTALNSTLTTAVGFLDPSTWMWIQNKSGIDTAFKDRPDLETSKEIYCEYWSAFICSAWWKNSKLTGVTAS